MSKTKSITDLVEELQQENESLKRLEKFANQYCKQEFGYTVKELHIIVQKQEASAIQIKDKDVSQQGQQIKLSPSES